MRGNISSRTVLVLSLAVAILGFAGSAAWAAVPVGIVNAGFENPVLTDGDWQGTIPNWGQGWYNLTPPAVPTVWVAVNLNGDAGVYNVSTSEYTSGTAPEGLNMAFADGYAGYDYGINQVLLGATSKLQKDATYVLSATVGNPFLYNDALAPNYRIELVAGGTVLASATGASPVDDTTWATPSLTYNSGAAPAQLGQQLEIRLIAANDARDAGYEVDFDAVSLNATYAHPISDPDGAYSLIPSGSLSLNGSGSLPKDGSSISLYEWDLNNDGTYGDATGATPAAIGYATLTGTWGMIKGDNTVKLRVTDATTAETSIESTIVTLLDNPIITFTGANKTNGDNWNVTTNWDSTAVPTGAVDVVIPAGKQVTAASAATTIYSGNLSIGANAYLQIGYTDNNLEDYNALGTPGTTIISMGAGSTLAVSRVSGTHIIPAIQLLGNVTIRTGQSTNTSPTLKFDYGITGAYSVTFMGKSDSKINLNAANSFSSFIADPLDGSAFLINANIAGSLGNGDVTIKAASNGDICANLVIVAGNAMADTATLTLNGPASATKLKMTGSDTITQLVVDGVQQLAGTYGKTGSGANYEVSWMNSTSTGILTVLGTPSAYWDLNGSDPASNGATPAGTWDAANNYWNTDSTGGGGGSIAAWTGGKTAVFAAGTDATGTYDVTVDGTRQIIGLTFAQGNVTLTPGTAGALQMTADSFVRVASGSTATIATPISNDGTPRRLSKGGNGTLALTGTNTYTGLTRIEAGTLVVASLANAGSDSPIGNYPTAGAGGLVLVGGTLQYTGGTAAVNRGFTLSGNSTIDVSTPGTALTLGDCASSDMPGTLTVTGGSGSSLSLGQIRIVEGANMTLNPTSVSMTVASVNGYSTYPLSSTITLSGSTAGNIVTGNLNVTNPPGSPYTQTLSVIKSGAGAWTILGVFSGGGAMTVNAGTLTLSGTNSYTGTTTVSGGTLIAGTDAPSNANGAFGKATTDVALGVASGNNAAGILIGGAYTVARSIHNTTANTTDAGTRVLTLGGNTAANSIFSGAIYLGTASQTSKGVTLTAASGGQVTFSGVIQDPTGQDATELASAAALNAVTKVGLGTVVLSNANTYTGKTVVNEGTLLVTNTSGSGTGTGAVTVNAGGTLGGSGTIGGAVSLIGGTLSPGTSPGTLTVGTDAVPKSVTMDADATYKWEFDGSIGDLVVIKGDLNLTEGWNLALVAAGGAPAFGSTHDLFTYTGSGPGSIAADIVAKPTDWPDFTIGQATGRVYLQFGLLGDTNNDGVVDAFDYITVKKNFGQTVAKDTNGDLNSSGTVDWEDLAILMTNFGAGDGAPGMTPEPATLGLLAFGALALVRRRRRA